jgi:hypothetical protein
MTPGTMCLTAMENARFLWSLATTVSLSIGEQLNARRADGNGCDLLVAAIPIAELEIGARSSATGTLSRSPVEMASEERRPDWA